MNDGKNGSLLDLTGSEYAITINNAIDTFLPLDPAVFAGVNTFQLRRGTQASPFTTSVENTQIKLILREY